MKVDETDYKIIGLLEEGISLEKRPYEKIGYKTGISEQEVISRIRAMQNDKVLKKIHARINQREIGISANALVAWNVPCGWDKCEGIASHPGVTHCYKRSPVPGKWDYTIYTVHHKAARKEVYEEVEEISKTISVDDYIVLFSSKELKRVPAVRIRDTGGCQN